MVSPDIWAWADADKPAAKVATVKAIAVFM
jgi:hypothetical protein